MVLFFVFTHDTIQKGVKLETSLLAERRFEVNKNGDKRSLFDTLVMDEEYEILFKRLFNQAHSEIVLSIPSDYIRNTPTDMQELYSEFPDFSVDKDFSLWLNMPSSFPLQYKKSIQTKIEEYLIANICYLWFQTKSPNDAKVYLMNKEKCEVDIRRLLNKRSKPMRRKPSFP